MLQFAGAHVWYKVVFPLFSMQRCPQPSLDICLIGMYPFVGCQIVSAGEDNVVLFTKASQENLQRSKR